MWHLGIRRLMFQIPKTRRVTHVEGLQSDACWNKGVGKSPQITEALRRSGLASVAVLMTHGGWAPMETCVSSTFGRFPVGCFSRKCRKGCSFIGEISIYKAKAWKPIARALELGWDLPLDPRSWGDARKACPPTPFRRSLRKTAHPASLIPTTYSKQRRKHCRKSSLGFCYSLVSCSIVFYTVSYAFFSLQDTRSRSPS